MNKVGGKEPIEKIDVHLPTSPNQKPAVDKQELKEDSKQGLGWMEQKIREAKAGSVLDDPLLKEFADTANNPDVSYDFEIDEKDKDGDPYKYKVVASSPNGRYVAAFCSNYKIRLIDLHAYQARESGKRLSDHPRSSVTLPSTVRPPSTNSRNPDPAVDVYVNGPHADYVQMFKDEYKLTDYQAKRYISPTSITWLPDSSNFLVTDAIKMVIYNVEACLQSMPGYCKTIQEFTDERKSIDTFKFQYFHQATIGNEYYLSIGIHLLLTGKGNDSITVTNFDMSVQTHSASTPIWPSICSQVIKMPPLYAEAFDKITRRDNVHHNNSNHFCLEIREGRIDMLKVYRLDISAENESRRFELKHAAEKPNYIYIIRNSLGAYGDFIYYIKGHKDVGKLYLNQDKLEIQLQLPVNKDCEKLAFKEEGKYLLFMDYLGWANLLMKTSTDSYLTLSRFYAFFDPERTDFTEGRPVSVNFSDRLEILGDGRGSIYFEKNKLRYRAFEIAFMPTNTALTVDKYFVHDNLFRNSDNTYTYEDYIRPVENIRKLKIQRIIDLKSKMQIKTFKIDGTPDDLFCIENTLPILPVLCVDHDKEDYGESDEESKHVDMLDRKISNKAFYVGIPECSYTVIWFYEQKLVVGYRFTNDGIAQIAWKIQVEYELRLRKNGNASKNWPLYFGNNGSYILEPLKGGGAKVYNIEADVDANGFLKPIAIVPLGDCFYVIDSNRIIAVYKKLDQDDVKCRMMRVFDIKENNFVGLPIEGAFGKLPFASPTSDYIFMPSKHESSVYGVKEDKIVSTTNKDICNAWHLDVESERYLFSPNGKILILTEKDRREILFLYSFPSLKQIAELSVGNVGYTYKWCFTHDSKYLLLYGSGSIKMYDVNTCSFLTKVTIANDYSDWHCNIYSLSVLKESTELEIMFAWDNYICFKRMPLYPTSINLALKTVHQKLTLFSKKTTKDNQKEESDVLSLITETQQTHQLYLDSTYLKLLCLYNDRGLITKFFEQLIDLDLVFKYSPYAKIVSIDVKHLSISANCFLDLIEMALLEDNKFPSEVNREILFVWLDDGLQINYHRRLMRIFSFFPLNVPVQGELKLELRTVNKIVTEEENITSEWLKIQKKALFKTDSPNVDDYDTFKTTIEFDMSKGSQFSLKYFEWMKRVSDEDLVKNYKGIIYYKWSRIYYWALAYSILLWILNGLFCAFMGFRPDILGLLIPILILNSLFILFEMKCLYSNPTRFIRDPWNFIDLLTHGFSVACASTVYSLYTTDLLDPIFYRLAWLRIISFVLIGVRGLSMLRVFRPTRYLITMLFAVFHEMLAFLSVFGYVIFIYWFVCLVRPSLTHFKSEEEVVPEHFFTSVQDALNIAFSNFDAGVDSTIVLVTTIMGNIVLGLVLLNYLIAIVSKTYETIADEKDLHDLKMVLTMIGEFDSFFAGLFKKVHAMQYFILKPVVNEEMQATQLTTLVSEMAKQKAYMAKQEKIITELKASSAKQEKSMDKQECIISELKDSMVDHKATMAQMMTILAELKASLAKPEPTTANQASLMPENNSNEADRKAN